MDRNLTCRICGNAENNQTYTVAEMLFGLGDRFTYFQCAACKCLQIAEIPRDMSRYYPAKYYSHTLDPRAKYRNPIIRLMRRAGDSATVFSSSLAGRVIGRLSPNKKLLSLAPLELTKRSRILEVGCGTGWRLYALRNIGMENLLGVDPYIREDIIYGNGLRVLKKSIHDAGGEWDVVMYHHSFEHVPDPIENLRSAARLLREGGTCLIRIPTVSSWAWEHYREHWVQLDAPRHFFLHSVESMRALAEKTGFILSGIRYDSNNDQFQGSELYKMGVPLVPYRSTEIFTKSRIKRWKRKADKLNKENRGDQAAFYLRKA